MEWIAGLLDTLFIWLPRVLIIRSTHGGIKWQASLFKREEPKIVELKPGLHWYWPLTSEVETLVTARRPVDVPVMSLLTADGQSIAISASVVFRINDVVAALGQRNWDVDSTLVDITQHIIFTAIRKRFYEQLLADQNLRKEITEYTKKDLKRFGIHVERVLLRDMDKSKTFRMLGETSALVEADEE